MHSVGVIEIVAGVLVLDRRTTRFGAYLVAAWLAAIALNLITMGAYLDVAVRDLVMGIGAVTLSHRQAHRASDRGEANHGTHSTGARPPGRIRARSYLRPR
jgi:hypothetical protein